MSFANIHKLIAGNDTILNAQACLMASVQPLVTLAIAAVPLALGAISTAFGRPRKVSLFFPDPSVMEREMDFCFPAAERSRLVEADRFLQQNNPTAALKELDRLPGDLQLHPPVLHRRLQACRASEAWEAAIAVTKALLSYDSSDVFAWESHAHMLAKAGRLHEAVALLTKARRRFPTRPEVPYLLAQFACAEKNLPEASRLLEEAFLLDDSESMRRQAGNDPALSALFHDGPGLHPFARRVPGRPA